MKKWIFLILAVPALSHGALTKFWVSNGGKKVPQDDLPPSTTNYNWNATTATTFGAQNETVSLVLYIGNDTASDIAEVNVAISSFTGTDPDGITSVVVSSMNVWNMVGRPIQQFIVRYLPIQGMSTLPYESYYDEYHAPEAMRRPCTETANGNCTANADTHWVDRPNHDKYYPEILEPYENVSSFTVYASSSQAIWFDIYISTALDPGDYAANIQVKEGVSVSTTIPVTLHVYNFALPDVPYLKALLFISDEQLSDRMRGAHNSSTAVSTPEPYYTTRKRFYQMAHAHSLIPIGNDKVAADTPFEIDVARLNGTLYSSATGYAGRGTDTGDTVYSIGTYASWQGQWGSTDADDFCGHIGNWRTYFHDNFPNVKSFLGLADETLDSGNVEKWANWMSTVTACQATDYGGINSFVTYPWYSVQTDAPHVNMPCAGSFLAVSSETWQTAFDYFAQGLTPGTTSVCAYNGKRPPGGTVSLTEDEGISPVAMVWGHYKKGTQYYFYWDSAYYNNAQGNTGDTHLWTNAHTFGYYTSDNADLGRTGSNYTNGDGVLMYPGMDSVYSADSRGVDAPYASWRLKMWRRGMQDYDYLTMAHAINASTVDAMVETRVPKVLWEFECFNPADCTYEYGAPTWTSDPDPWEEDRETLAQLLDGSNPDQKSQLRGSSQFRGGAVLR